MNKKVKKAIEKEMAKVRKKFVKKHEKKETASTKNKLEEISVLYTEAFRGNNISLSELNEFIYSLELGETGSVEFTNVGLLIKFEVNYFPLGEIGEKIKKYLKCSAKVSFSLLTSIKMDESMSREDVVSFALDMFSELINEEKLDYILDNIIGFAKKKSS